MINILEILNQKVEFEVPPPELCLKCGKCCRTIVSEIPNEQLAAMAQNNEEEAKVFFNIFKPYSSVDEARKANPEHVDEILKKLQKGKNADNENITFFYCPYVTEDNLCKIYPHRPDCCKRAPINGWALFPEGCGYEGWQFLQREKHQSRIRYLKEFLYELNTIVDDDNKNILGMPVEELKNKIIEKILEYERYGANKW